MADLHTEKLMLAEIRKLEQKYKLRIAAIGEQKPDGTISSYLVFAPLEAIPHSPVYLRRPKKRGKFN